MINGRFSDQEFSSPLTVVFDEEVLCERGTSIAVYDYARALRGLAQVHPIVIFDDAKTRDHAAIARFSRSFELRSYQGEDDRRRLVESLSTDLYYYLKLHAQDNRQFNHVPVATHIVFDLPPNPHGRNAYISRWLSSFMTRDVLPVVPHIVTLPPPLGDIRSVAGIPPEAVVVGRHGGRDTFDLAFVRDTILKALTARADLWFLFINTPRFTDHPRVVFRPAIHDRQSVSDFIAACDAMIHGRARGESFGLAMAEFLFHGRPVYCWGGGRDRNHLVLQPVSTNVYWTRYDLKSLLLGTRRWTPGLAASYDLRAYTEEAVSQAFFDTFLSPAQTRAPPFPLRRSHEAKRRLWNRVSLLRDRVLTTI